MIRRLFAIWPPGWALAGTGIVYLVIQGACIYEEIALHVPLFNMTDGGLLIVALLTLCSVVYGIYRVTAFHPGCRPAYYEWLCRTPWTSAKPLPLGPVHLVWQDLLLLAILFALGWPRAHWRCLFLINGFLVGYLLTLGSVHYQSGQKAWAYATYFGLGAIIFLAREGPAFVVATACVYGITYLGLRASLAAFPWNDTLRKTLQGIKKMSQQAQKDDKVLGWPYDRLGPERLDDADPAWDTKLVFGVLMGWWFFVVHMQFRQAGQDGNGYLIYYWALLGGTIYRVAAYLNGYSAPLDLLGRLMTGRLIIPGYDQAFIAPVCAALVGLVVWYLPTLVDVDPLHVNTAALVSTWWILYAMPPSLKTWRLTGNHRIEPGMMKAVEQHQ